MNISDIHFHDTQILRVVEDTATDTLTMYVDYPVDWQRGVFEHRRLVFSDAYNYQVHEMPFSGVPTILDVDVLETNDPLTRQYPDTNRWTRLRLKTNAGFRDVSCVSVTLTHDDHAD
jgi:hypothetical protein